MDQHWNKKSKEDCAHFWSLEQQANGWGLGPNPTKSKKNVFFHFSYSVNDACSKQFMSSVFEKVSFSKLPDPE
jgi:hypothetical protein